MPKINILDKSVYSLIAAGEVIDKPASVVKELLENSIDAGATHISIDIKNGGIDYIRVTDNGCGISEDQLSIAFLPHTTSKIKEKEDLYNIGTLGFRGEALSTITAVSKVTMMSRIQDSNSGHMIRIDGGEIIKQEPIGCSVGTTVISEDLFFNIPARRKFLRKPKSEESEITNIVSRIILSHPSISIQYTANDKLIYNSSGNGLFDAIYAIYGKEVVNNLIPIHIEKEYLKIDGYIGKTTYTKPNRTYQTLIVNGRYVINQTVSTAIYKSYENYIMKNNFPFFVINLNINNNMIDVNVHPNKLDVKFSNSNALYEIFLTEISKAIIDSINIENIVLTNNLNEDKTPELDLTNLQKIDRTEGISYQPNENCNNTQVVEVQLNTSSKSNEASREYFKTLNFNIASKLLKPKDEDFSDIKLELRAPIEQKWKESEIIQEPIKVKEEIVQLDALDNVQQSKPLDNSKILGTIFDTYIVAEQNDYLLLIDQHAGHERILYDQYCVQLNQLEISSQPLLVPYLLNTNALEYAYIEENINLLNELGFDIAPFGDNTYRISSVPLIIHNINIKLFFEEVLNNVNNKLRSSKNELLKDFLAKTACKHAIKANDKLDKSQIEKLVSMLEDTPILLCPHGRPIILKITKKEIEKWFKRIV